ncbi:MAG TPA: NAD(P)-dependent oxidoreductase [Actinomycetes bacterium]|nr:NAD(P)-dependent oxidoreductase [Actinomycetes bacterium]
MHVAVTGAAGEIGSTLLPGLRALGHDVRGLDRRPPDAPDPQVQLGDVRDAAALDELLRGADAVVHLAGNPNETDLPTALESHVLSTAAVLEAMVRNKVGRLVLASSNHAVGRTPRSNLLRTDVAHRPDTFYGVGKVAAEALTHLYVDRHGLSAVCLRIGSFLDRPTSRRALSTWLSPADAVRLVHAALTAADVGFAVVYGVSANTRGWWDLGPARALGYEPRDDAETYADEVLATPASDEDENEAAYVGGPYATDTFARPAFDEVPA